MTKKILALLAAATFFLAPTIADAQVFSQSQVIIPPFGNGVIVSTSTANGAKLQASSSPSLASIYATSTTATSSIAHLSVAQLATGSLTGILKAVGGYIQTALVNLTSDVTGILPIGNGGTGTSTAPTYGKILIGDANGNYELTATSSLGITSFAYPFPANATSTVLTLSGGSIIGNNLTLSGITGSTQCLHVNTSGVVSGTGSDCGSGSGGVTSLTATYPLIASASTGAVTLSTAFSTTTANTFSALNIFNGNATTTALTVSGTTWLTALSTPAGTFLAVDQNGKVIATTSPTGTNYFTLTGNNLQNNVGNALGVNTAPSLSNLEVQASSTTASPFTAWNSAGASLFTIAANGNVGVGTSSPNSLITVQGTGGSPSLLELANAQSSSPSWKFTTGNAGNCDGYLRIGTTTLGSCVSSYDAEFVPDGGFTEQYYVSSPSYNSNITGRGGVQILSWTNTGGNFNGTLTVGQFFPLGTSNINEYIGPVGGAWSLIDGQGGPTFVTVLGPSGYMGIGTSTPYAMLSIATSTQSSGLTALFAVASSTNATLFDILGNGRVGIATTTPGSLLSIGNTGSGINLTLATSTFTNAGGINLTGANPGCYAINGTCVGGSSFSNTLANGGTATTTFYNGGVVFSDGTKLTQAPNVNASAFFYDNTNGWLGIGTTTPSSALAIQETAPRITLRDTTAGGNTYNLENGTLNGIGGLPVTGDFDIYDVKSKVPVFYWAHQPTAGSGEFMIGTSSNTILSNNSRLFVFGGTNGANIDTMGDPNVSGGFGDTTSIEAEGSDYNSATGGGVSSLSIRYYGPANPAGSYLGYPEQRLGILDFAAASTSIISTGFNQLNVASDLIFGTGYTQRAVLAGTGKFGVGTTTPYANLSVQGIAGASALSSVFVVASTTNATLLTVLGNGNVGIGSTTPGSLLSIGTLGTNFFNNSTTTKNGVGGVNINDGCFAFKGTCLTSGGYSPVGTTGQFPYFSASNTLTATSSLFMAASGFVGVGTTTPIGQFAIQSIVNSVSAFTIANAAGSNVFNVDTTATNPFLGVGTTTPWATISVAGNGTSPLFAVASTTSQGFPNFELDSTGHIVTSGGKPVVSSCGTTNSISGNDTDGSIVFTGTLVTTCTMTFVTAVPAGQTLGCVVSDNSTAGFSGVTATSTTAVTFGISTGLASGAFFYHCERWQ